MMKCRLVYFFVWTSDSEKFFCQSSRPCFALGLRLMGTVEKMRAYEQTNLLNFGAVPYFNNNQSQDLRD